MELSSLSATRRSEDLAAQLRQLIRSGELVVGSRLPSQRELAAQFPLGRQAVQEALALLEFEGYVETRRGAHGGSFVREPTADTDFWQERIRNSIGEFDEVLDFRMGVERQVAMLAAQRRSDEDLALMRAAIDALPVGSVEQSRRRALFREADSQFHMALTEAAGNGRLQRAVRESRAEMFIPTYHTPYVETIDVTRAQHLAIYLAIADRDGSAAAEAMDAHIGETRRHMHEFANETNP